MVCRQGGLSYSALKIRLVSAAIKHDNTEDPEFGMTHI
jgi:hypothetical protein